MPNYANSKIYTVRSYKTDELYVGCTTNALSRRMAQHRYLYKKKGALSAVMKYGDAYIELYEEYPCKNSDEVHKRMTEIIRELVCINRQ